MSGIIRPLQKDSVLIEGKHYIHPFGGRKILYIWETIEEEILSGGTNCLSIPMANGVVTMAKIRVRKETNKLFVDFRFQGQRFREQTMLDDNAKNRKRLEALVQKIEAAILLGQFDYEAFFPGSNNIKKLKEASVNHPSYPQTVDAFYS